MEPSSDGKLKAKVGGKKSNLAAEQPATLFEFILYPSLTDQLGTKLKGGSCRPRRRSDRERRSPICLTAATLEEVEQIEIPPLLPPPLLVFLTQILTLQYRTQTANVWVYHWCDLSFGDGETGLDSGKSRVDTILCHPKFDLCWINRLRARQNTPTFRGQTSLSKSQFRLTSLRETKPDYRKTRLLLLLLLTLCGRRILMMIVIGRGMEDWGQNEWS